MEIFNIHIFEFLLIAGLALVVFGPERLPEVGRFIGKQVARFLAWQQQSPELKMITDVRSEFEREIANLRDELVRTRKQLDISQDAEIKNLRDELRPMLNLRENQTPLPTHTGTIAPLQSETIPTTEAATLPKTWDEPLEDADLPLDENGNDLAVVEVEAGTPAEVEALFDTTTVAETAAEASEIAAAAAVAPSGTVPAAVRPNRLAATTPTNVLDQPDERLTYLNKHRSMLHDEAPHDDPVPVAPAPAVASLNGQGQASADAPLPGEVLLLMRRLEALSADVQALISGLQAQGVLGQDWEPTAAVNEQEGLTR